jgi:hypothetical protein
MATDGTIAKSPDETQHLELAKLRNEVERLERERADHAKEMRLRTVSALSSTAAFLTVLVALLSYCEQGRQFTQNLNEQGERFKKDVEKQGERLKETIRAEHGKIRQQFDRANESRYWENNLQLCSDIVATGAKLRVSKGMDSAAKHDLDLLLYGKSAMLENYRIDGLRHVMTVYSERFERCRSEQCSRELEVCVEAMACLCRVDLCRTASGEAPSIPGCQSLDCSDLKTQCIASAQPQQDGGRSN